MYRPYEEVPVSYERPEDARARRLAEIRSRRGSPERLAKIAELEADKARRSRPKSKSAPSGRKSPSNSVDMFGHPWQEWFAMRDAAYEFLRRCARDRSTTASGDVWHAVSEALGTDLGSHWRKLPHLLGHVSEHSHAESGVLASALVISVPDDQESGPGAGFFRVAASLGLIDRPDAPAAGTEWVMTEAQRGFWREQVDAVFAKFSDEPVSQVEVTD